MTDHRWLAIDVRPTLLYPVRENIQYSEKITIELLKYYTHMSDITYVRRHVHCKFTSLSDTTAMYFAYSSVLLRSASSKQTFIIIHVRRPMYMYVHVS